MESAELEKATVLLGMVRTQPGIEMSQALVWDWQ
jgi:hypothetical protein